jgi:hypothetical protein
MPLLRLVVLVAFAPLSAAAQDDRCNWLYLPNAEDALASKVGHSVIYPMDKAAFEVTFKCLSSSYTQTKVSLAGRTWDITHALLRLMSADPVQFMNLYTAAPAIQSQKWREAFLYAALWPSESCPKSNPMQLAAISLKSANLIPSMATHRKEILAALAKAPCRVAQ